MAKLTSTFNLGIMNKDLDRSIVPNGSFRDSKNFRFHINDGNDGIGKNIKGTNLIQDVTNGQTYKCVKAFFNEDKNVIYYFLASPDRVRSKIVEYDLVSLNTTVIIEDDQSILRFNPNGYITGVNEIEGLLYFAEWTNNPRRINVERAKTYSLNGFTEEDIMVAVIPPHQKLKITLLNTITNKGTDNNIEEKFLSFSYRYRYLDGEYSALAPFTNYAFEPKSFDYNFTEQSNRSMINKFNQVDIEFDTGNERVVEIQLVYKETESNSEWVIDDFNKSQLGYGDNEIVKFSFDNSKVYRALPDNVIRSYFDNVPREAKAQSIIESRLLYAHYKEQYDLKDISLSDINIDFKLLLDSVSNTTETLEDELGADDLPTGNQIIVQRPTLIPKKTAHSNRDVEVGIVYSDEHGRSTTVLVSKTNTLKIPASASDKQNSIKVELNHKPPYWAKYYRFFITQNKNGYDSFLPTLFYQDGVYRFIKVEQSDIDKFKVGDFLIVKSDDEGIVRNVEKLKVLELERKDKDFLTEENGGQPSGWYLKVSLIDSDVSFNEDAYTFVESKHYDESDDGRNKIGNTNLNFTEKIFKGDTLDDLTPTVLYTLGVDLRYEIEITDTFGAIDKFRWRTQESDGTINSWSLEADIDTNPIVLDADVSISFGALTGHSLEDNWLVKKNVGFNEDEDNRAYAIFDIPLQITAGSNIKLKYTHRKEKSPADRYFLVDLIANKNYDNFEEWFYGDQVYSQIEPQPEFTFSEQKFWFRRSNVENKQNNFNGIPVGRPYNEIEVSETGQRHVLIIEGNQRKSSREVYSDVYSEIRKINNIPIFETEPKDQAPDIFYEISRTYRVINNYHSHITNDYETELSNFVDDQSQTASLPLIVKLDWFNAWCYGNGVESYKIKDEFNKKGLSVGVRTLSNIKDRYREVIRKTDVTWSDIFNSDSDFNGLNWFNLSASNFITLDRESGSIQLIDNDNGNLLVLQESAVGLMPYNKQVIYDTQGGQTIGVSTNVLDEKSWQAYASGEHGISLHPESYVKYENVKLFTDQKRGNVIQLANNGITTVRQFGYEYEAARLMQANQTNLLMGAYDPVHKEYLIALPSEQETLSYKTDKNGFPTQYIMLPDFMLGANNKLYGWKNGVMYEMNATNVFNNFFGVQTDSFIKLFENTDPTLEKLWKSISLQSNRPATARIATRLTSCEIPEICFEKYEDYFYATIMGNTNNEVQSNSQFGLGSYEIVNGIINCTSGVPSTLSIGDTIISANLLFPPISVINIQGRFIILSDSNTNTVSSFLIYQKDQSIDGQSIRGDILDIELTFEGSASLELRAVNTEVAQSNYNN